MSGRGATRGDSVFSHLRSGFVAFFLVAGFATPAASNAFTDLFSLNAAPEAIHRGSRSRPRGVLAATRQVDSCRPALGLSLRWPTQMLVPDRRRHRVGQEAGSSSRREAKRPHSRRRTSPLCASRRTSMMRVRSCGAPHRRKHPSRRRPRPSSRWSTPCQSGWRMPRGWSSRQRPSSTSPVPIISPPISRRRAGSTSNRFWRKRRQRAMQITSAPPATPIAGPGAKTGGDDDWTTSWLGVLLMALGGTALLARVVRFGGPSGRCDF